MPPQVALGLTIALIFWLFRRDMRLRALPSAALWIPAVWLAQAASRTITQWLATFGLNVYGANNLEGNPLDLVLFFGLMIAAVAVLRRRGLDWGSFARSNKALVAIYLYLLLSAFWAEHSLPTVKRVVRDFGNVLVALVLLSEADPLRAIRIVYVRLSYLLFPLSVLFIRYFPVIGRIGARSHNNLFTGVTTHKNSLGCMVFVFSMFLILDLWEMRRRGDPREKTDEWIRYGLLAMGAWLLLTCQSATSTICLMLGGFLFWATGRLLRMQNPRQMLLRCLTAIACLAVLEYGFNASAFILATFGRDSTLTGRAEIWEMVRQAQAHPLLGCGFFSFWSSEGAQEISDKFQGLATAHNGLLDMYMDGGAIGLGLLILLLLVWGRRSIQQMLEGTVLGRFTLSFWLLAVLHNFSETEYFRPNPLWFTLPLLMLECPYSPQPRAVKDPAASAPALRTA